MKAMTTKLTAAVATALVLLTGCSQPESDAPAGAADPARLDLSAAPNKVTADDYRLEPVVTGDGPVTSIDADGNVAPFGMASREQRDVAPAPAVAAAVAVAGAAAPAVYMTNCVACHGADAQGVEGLGLPLAGSELVAQSSEAEIVEFLKAGRMPGSPDSVTGIPMPSFAWMPQGELEEVAGYLKTL